MQIIYNFQDKHVTNDPVVLTIGNFDGVHLGHQFVLKNLKKIARKKNQKTVLVTFENHPSDILYPEKKASLITNLPFKLKLLEQEGIDFLLLLRFTDSLRNETAEQFLKRIKDNFLFSDLVLGYDGAIGKEKEGKEQMLRLYEQPLQYHLDYLPPLRLHDEIISSRNIRQLIQAGNLEKVGQFLGRPYSIYTTIIPGQSLGSKIGYPTLNLDVSNLCLPPFGVYAVTFVIHDKQFAGIANLGIAPTVRKDGRPLLEVHLLDYEGGVNLHDQLSEVIFHSYLRPEIKFDSTDALRQQIAKDIASIKY